MKKFRKAFSIIEIILTFIIVGLLAVVFIPATARVKIKVRNNMINEQLVKIVEAGNSYMTERNMQQVAYTTLLNEKRIKDIHSIAGEKYDNLIIKKSGGIFILDIPNGNPYEYKY